MVRDGTDIEREKAVSIVIGNRRVSPRYDWGEGCEGWRVVDRPELSVIEERMPLGTTEIRHVHRNATQVFHVLEGLLTLEVEGESVGLRQGDTLTVPAVRAHQVFNAGTSSERFLVISAPNTFGDRAEM